MSDIVERLHCTIRCDIETAASGCHCAEGRDVITALRAENERLRIEKIQMQAALGYAIRAEDERHILPSNPFKCGTCDANKHLRAENERLRAALEAWDNAVRVHVMMEKPVFIGVSPTLGRLAWEKARAALEDRHD